MRRVGAIFKSRICFIRAIGLIRYNLEYEPSPSPKFTHYRFAAAVYDSGCIDDTAWQ